MSVFLNVLNTALQGALDGDPPPPAILTGLENKLAELEQVEVAWGGNGIEDWLADFRSIFDNQPLRDSLLVRVLQQRFPRLAEALTIAGVITFEFTGETLHAFHIDQTRLNNLLQNPGATLAEPAWWLGKIQKIEDIKLAQVYLSMLVLAPQALIALEYAKQGFAALPAPGVPGATLDDLIALVSSPLRAKLPVDTTPPLDLAAFTSTIDNEATTDYLALVGPDGFDANHPISGMGVEMRLAAPQQMLGGKVLDLGNGWQVRFSTTATTDGQYRLIVQNEAISLASADGSNADLEVLVSRSPGQGIVVGPNDGTRFQIERASVGLQLKDVTASPDQPRFGITAQLEKLELVLATNALGPVRSALQVPNEIQFSTDVKLSYLQGSGLQAQESAGGQAPLGAQFMIPLNLKLGGSGAGVAIDRVMVRFELSGGDRSFQVLMRFGATGHIGPLRVTIDEAGAWVGRRNGRAGGLLRPEGIGLTLDAGPVSGGGFLKFIPPREYGGALQLKILGIGAFAYGIFGSLPSGETTFVALIGIRFPVGIQLGFGFAIGGFGGLIGINRRADTDLLRERLASGAAGNVLFNDNPTANAPALLADLGRFFPGEAGVFILGPTLQITWLELLRLDAGVFIELPGPRKVFIAGSARMVIGASEELALIYLRLDFIGGIDFTKTLIFFDAALVNSHVIHVFKLTGGSALRINYGPNGYFLFSAGGFHPSFNPGPLELPSLARVGSVMSVDIAVAKAWLKQQMYVALTSNTFQLGAMTEAGIEIGPISAHGWFGFDALVQFEPFHFIATIDAGFDVEVEGVSLCGVRVTGQLSGPGPLVVHAKARVKILFVPISESVTIELGGTPSSQPAPISDVLGHLHKELANPANLRAEGEDRSVIFRPLEPPPALPIVSPVGVLIWEQRRAPLGLDIQRLEGAPLDGTHHLTIEAVGLTSEPERDWFGVGTYRVLNDSEALNNARLSEEQSGLRVGKGSNLRPAPVDCDITINLIKLPKRTLFSDLIVLPYLSHDFLTMQAEVDRTPHADGGPAQIRVVPGAWQVLNASTGQPESIGQGSIQAFAEAKKSGAVAVSAADTTVDLAGVFS